MTSLYRVNHKRIMQLLIKYRGGKCVECGATTDLHFHHRDPTTKKFAVSSRAGYSIGEKHLEAMKVEADKCDLLCSECHYKKHMGKQRHGTKSMYRWCHCDKCRKAHNDWEQEYRKRRVKSGVVYKHGTTTSYRYCKCPRCSKAAMDYQREYKKRKKAEKMARLGN